MRARISRRGAPLRVLPGNPVVLEGNHVKISILAQGAEYDGELAADGNTIEGGLISSVTLGIPAPLKLTRTTPGTEWTLSRPAPLAADADPVFEAASVTPAGPNRPGFAMGTLREFNAGGMSLVDLIMWAYSVSDQQIEGVPDWARSVEFNLNGRARGAGQPSLAQWRTMVRKLLAERFELALHTEQRELPVYTIGLDESGPKLVPTTDPGRDPFPPFPRGVWATSNTTMEEMAGLLAVFALDRPVIDRTGLTGAYDFTVIWKADDSQFRLLERDNPRIDPPFTHDAPDLATAMRQTLGLKFESTTAPVDVLVIDRAEQPSAD